MTDLIYLIQMKEKQKNIMIAIVTATLAFLTAYFIFQFSEDKDKDLEKTIIAEKTTQEKPIVTQDLPDETKETPPVVSESPKEIAELIKNKEIDGKNYILSLSNNKKWKKLCLTKSLIRKIVVLTLAVSRDENPSILFKDEDILSKFKVVSGKGKIFLSPHNYERVNFIIEVIKKTPAKNIASFLKSMEKELNLTLKDLGETQTFKSVMNEAVNNVIKRQINVKGLIKLKKKINTYKFVNPKYEKLSPISKIFIRIGEKNSKIIIDYLKKIRENY